MTRYLAVLTLLVAVSCCCWPVNAGMLKKLLMAQLLTTPRVIAVPVPVHPRPPPYHYHAPPPPPAPAMVPVPVPVHHYHYPPTHILPPPVVKLPPAELTDLSHLHALFDATNVHPHHAPHHDLQFDVVEVSTTSASKPKKTTSPAFAAYTAALLKQQQQQEQSKLGTSASKEQALWSAMKQAGMSAPESEDWKPYMPQYSLQSRASMKSSQDSYDWLDQQMPYQSRPAMSSAYYSRKATTYPKMQSLYYRKSPSYSSMPAASYEGNEYGWSDGGSFLYRGAAKKASAYSPQNYDWATEVASAYKTSSPKSTVESGTSSGPAARHDVEDDAREFTSGALTYASNKISTSTDATTTAASTASTTTTQASKLEAPEPPLATSASRRAVTVVRKSGRKTRR